MNRNTESRFAMNPTRLDLSRSRFDRSSSVKLTFNAGSLIPFYLDEVLPGDTFSIDTSKVIRMQTLLTPIMDNLYCDFYWFFVPNRLVWTHWRELMGENRSTQWIPTASYTVPQVYFPKGSGDAGWNIGTIADYMGLPTGVNAFGAASDMSVSALPFRAYALIFNEWFRDENIVQFVNVPTGDTSVMGSNSDPVYGGVPYKVAKYHDYFTSCLPSPQKGPDVAIPMNDIPVVTRTQDVTPYMVGSLYPLNFRQTNLNVLSTGAYNLYLNSPDGVNPYVANVDSATTSPSFGKSVYPNNLWAAASSATIGTINQLRLAFQIQKFYERDARGGTRYIEILKSHFGVTSPDARLQRPEYLGGNRVPININQVVQQSATTTGGTPQGTFTGVSQTSDVHSDFTHSFTEHGFILGLLCVRYDHTYQQGIERFWSRRDRLDYYWPVFANIGEQAVLSKEIYADGTSSDAAVFGYQEAWADYRYKPSRVTGEMRSAAATSLDFWHLADDYSSRPILSTAWIEEDPAPVDRVLAVQSSVSNQFFADIYVKNRCTRCMPLYSIPGLIDHH